MFYSSRICYLLGLKWKFCHASGDYHTAGCAWNDSFHKVTQITSGASYYQCIYHKKSFSYNHARERDFIFLDLKKQETLLD